MTTEPQTPVCCCPHICPVHGDDAECDCEHLRVDHLSSPGHNWEWCRLCSCARFHPYDAEPD